MAFFSELASVGTKVPHNALLPLFLVRVACGHPEKLRQSLHPLLGNQYLRQKRCYIIYVRLLFPSKQGRQPRFSPRVVAVHWFLVSWYISQGQQSVQRRNDRFHIVPSKPSMSPSRYPFT